MPKPLTREQILTRRPSKPRQKTPSLVGPSFPDFVGRFATDDSLARRRRCLVEELPRRAARAQLRAGIRPTPFDVLDVQNAALALAGMEGEERWWFLEMLADVRKSRKRATLELLRKLCPPRRRVLPEDEINSEIEDLVWQRERFGEDKIAKDQAFALLAPPKDDAGNVVDDPSFHVTRPYSLGWMPAGARLPFTLEELRAAIQSRRHRTDEQKLILDTFRVYLAYRKPRSKLVAVALECGLRTVKRYRAEGVHMLEEIIAREVRAAVSDIVREEHDRHLQEILTALGIDPVAEAERALEDAG